MQTDHEFQSRAPNQGAASATFWMLLSLMVWVGANAGCASWDTSNTTNGESASDVAAKVPGLPSVKISDGAAIVDIAFLEIPASTVGNSQVFPWTVMDEAVIPIETRARLEENGFRVGRIVAFDVSQMPLATEEGEEQVGTMGWTSDFDRRVRRLVCNAGHPYKLVLRRPKGDHSSVLVRGAAGVSGRSLWDPQFNMGLRTNRMDDGRVVVKLVPEIHHGVVRRGYVSNDSLAFRMDSSREVWVLDELAIEVPLDEGQAVVILPQDDAFGLAKQMLVGRKADDSEERTAVVVHLSRRPRVSVDGSR